MVCHGHRQRASQNAVILSRALAQGELPPCFLLAHTPIKGFDCTDSDDDQRAEGGGMKERRKEELGNWNKEAQR